MATFTHRQREERQERVQKMIEDGMSLSEMARELEISQQAVHDFLKVRGWKTKAMKQREPDPEVEARKAARKAARQKIKSAVDRSGSKRHKPKTT